MNKKVLFGLGLVLVVVLGFTFFGGKAKDESNINEENDKQQEVAKSVINRQIDGPCPQDVKQCPDGSYVSRVGESCQFADCSGLVADSFPGSYVVYHEDTFNLDNNDKEGNLVLFFRASWCPSCRALDKNIKENSIEIPSGIWILDVDYDKYGDLKKKYGVTYQHTLVQINENGEMIKKWSGSATLAELLKEIKK